MTTVPTDRARGETPERDGGLPPGRAASLIGGHRADIEGLRAIAVVAVLLYHAHVAGFDGGYVGVDVFFALSGYLMTGLLVTEHRRNGRISLRSFYARRARRLLPASALVLVVTTVASWWILSPLAFERAGRDAMAAGSYIVNLRFANQATDYLAADVDLSPVLHYWSLAVEEQFYAIWPLLLWFALGRARVTGRGRSVRPVAVLAALSLVSFVIAVRVTTTEQPWAFFGLHARAWEFGLGGLAAFATPHALRWGAAWRIGVGWVGLGIVAWSIVTFDSTTRFPGPGAMLPVAGTVLVLLGGMVRGGAATVLAPRPMQWIGGRSYAMYLWHWPPLVLVPVALDRTLNAWQNVGLVVLACGAAVLSHRLVEDPIRFSTWLARTPWRNGLLAAGLTVAAVGVPWAFVRNVELGGGGVAAPTLTPGQIADELGGGAAPTSTADPGPTGGTGAATTLPGSIPPVSTLPDSTPPVSTPPVSTVPPTTADVPKPVPANLTPSLADVANDRSPAYDAGCHVDQRTAEPALPCEFGDLEADRTMVLFGDSHMAQWLPAFVRVGDDLGWKIVSMTKSACPSVTLELFNDTLHRDYTECDQWRERVFEVIDDLRPDVVVIANYPLRSKSTLGDDRSEYDSTWEAGMRTTVSRLRSTGADVLVMGATPIPGKLVPDCVSEHVDDTRPCDLPRRRAVYDDRAGRERALADELGATYVDVSGWFCGATTCPVVIGQYLVYRDGSHISTPYATFLAPELEARLADVGLG